jgi:hypothetical protein
MHTKFWLEIVEDLGLNGSIKLDLREIGLEGMDWIHLGQDRDWWLGSSEHSNKPLASIKGGEFLG